MEYKCCICKRVQEEKPIRIVKQIYGAGRHKQYYGVGHYDFCRRCYKTIERWLDKYDAKIDKKARKVVE